MGALHETVKSGHAFFWRAFLGSSAVAGVFFDVKDLRSNYINFHLRFFLGPEGAFEIIFFPVKVG